VAVKTEQHLVHQIAAPGDDLGGGVDLEFRRGALAGQKAEQVDQADGDDRQQQRQGILQEATHGDYLSGTTNTGLRLDGG
jgi:hypothetical protein